MDLFTRKRLTFWAIAVLAGINLLSLGLLWWGRLRPVPPVPLPEGEAPARAETMDFLRRELGLQSHQVGRFRSMRNEFFRDLSRLESNMHFHRGDLMNAALSVPPDTLRMRALADTLGRLQADLEWRRAAHFQEMGASCTPSQRQRLQSLFHGTHRMRRMRPGFEERFPDSTTEKGRRGRGRNNAPERFMRPGGERQAPTE
ncbi:MAG TPA: periplasmic heavy metal sensor [bacterium]|nr:periplasmic heavy metal sensor [bacterium]